MTSRKDYIKFANALAASENDTLDVYQIADIFESDNPRFDRNRFLEYIHKKREEIHKEKKTKIK